MRNTNSTRAASDTTVKRKHRIGIHLGTAGGVFKAAERAQAIGANTVQIFSSSPRMWRPSLLAPEACARMAELRALHDIDPLVIHTSYLVNLCSQSELVRKNSITAFHGEVERAVQLCAGYLVLHPGSWKGLTREEGLRLFVESMKRALDGIRLDSAPLRILVENTAGAEFSLGGSLENVAEIVERVEKAAPVAVCLDTCHLHVAGYGIVGADEYEATVEAIGKTAGLDRVRVWHMNDAKAARGSKLDRHEHIGEGTIGAPTFRRLLQDARFAHAAFIAETPVDEPEDDVRNLAALRSLAASPTRATV